MLKRQKVKGSKNVKVTFVVPHDPVKGKTSVVGDFNDWEVGVDNLVKRSNDTRSTSVTLAPGRYAFRYCTEDGEWFNDDSADAYEMNEEGFENCIVVV